MSKTDPKRTRETIVHQNAHGKVVTDTTFQYSDGHTEEHILYSIGPTVTIVAIIEGAKPELIIVSEFKEGINQRHLACPGARIKVQEHENAIYAAVRRLHQETGYEPRHPTPRKAPGVWLGAGPFMARSCKDEVDIVLLRNCTKVAEPELRPGEHVTVHRYTLEHLLKLIRKNKISDVHAGNAVFRALLHLGWIKLCVPRKKKPKNPRK